MKNILKRSLSMLLAVMMIASMMVTNTAFAEDVVIDLETSISDTTSGTAIGTTSGTAIGTTSGTAITIINPYESVDWDTYGQYKADFHSHTTESDGGNTAKQMIEDHYAKGFDILAITDHNFTNTTWDRTDRPAEKVYLTPERLAEIQEGTDRDGRGMTAIEYSNEQSRSDHLNTFFLDFNNASGATLESNIIAAHEAGAISHINHPGRYTGGDKGIEVGDIISRDPVVVKKYVDLFEKYDSIVGMEIINKKDGDSLSDRILWDSILRQTMPGRPVWGFSNDDTHSTGATGFSYNMMLLPENTVENVRESMENGTFYAVAKVAKRELGFDFSSVGETPKITNIAVDQDENTITIEGEYYNEIEWVVDSEVIATGNSIDLDDHEGEVYNYIRAQLIGEGGISFTQPFGIEGGTNNENEQKLAEVSLTVDKNTLKPNEPVKLTLTGKDQNGNNIDMSKAFVEYKVDTNGIIEISKDGTVTLANPPLVNMNINISANALYNYTKASSNDISISVIVNDSKGIYIINSIKTGNDDVEQYVLDGKMYLDSSDLEIVWESPNSSTDKEEQIIGLRYTGLSIPKGAKIKEAYIQFTVDEPDKNADPFNVKIYAEKVNNSAAFTTEAYNVSNRAKTENFAEWKDIPAWSIKQEAGANQRTSSIASVIQEVIDQEGWSNGNVLTLILTGTGTRTAEAYEGGGAKESPTLHVLYETEGEEDTTPDPGNDDDNNSGSNGGSKNNGDNSGNNSGNEDINNGKAPFIDISEEFWAKNEILILASKGIITGKGNRQFDPQGKVTRAEFAKMLTLAFDLLDENATEPFSDVSSNDWFSKYVASAVKSGIIQGYGDITFKPNNNISRLEMSVMIGRALKIKGHADIENINQFLKFADKNLVNYGESDLALAVKNGIIKGKPGNLFDPIGMSTRAEAASVIYRMLFAQ